MRGIGGASSNKHRRAVCELGCVWPATNRAWEKRTLIKKPQSINQRKVTDGGDSLPDRLLLASRAFLFSFCRSNICKLRSIIIFSPINMQSFQICSRLPMNRHLHTQHVHGPPHPIYNLHVAHARMKNLAAVQLHKPPLHRHGRGHRRCCCPSCVRQCFGRRPFAGHCWRR
jgi:hypothetical protein